MSAHRSLHLEPLFIEPNRDELLRYLGYARATTKPRQLPPVVEAALTEGWSSLHPRGIAVVYSVDQQRPDELVVNGVSLRGQVSRFLQGASEVAAFLVTVGDEVTKLAQQAMHDGDTVRGWAFDALGSFAAEAAAAALAKNLEGAGQVSPRYSPGYCGMDLTTQSALFTLFDATQIGVSLLSSMLMQPTKSVSGLLGIGPMGSFPKGRTPCERCKKLDCSMRR